MKFSPYTDLALEIAENICNSPDGIDVKKEECKLENTYLTVVEITNAKGAEQMGRPIGTYITLESEFIKENDIEAHEKLIEILSK